MSIDWSKPVRHTKSHDPVRVLCTDRPGTNRHPVLLLNPEGVVFSCSLSGLVNGEKKFENIPETVEIDVWFNVYPDGTITWYCSPFDANNYANMARIACINIKRTVEVGEGLNK